MNCPYCDCDKTKVVDVKRGPDEIVRRRKCTNCGKSFHTLESDIPDELGNKLLWRYAKQYYCSSSS